MEPQPGEFYPSKQALACRKVVLEDRVGKRARDRKRDKRLKRFGPDL